MTHRLDPDGLCAFSDLPAASCAAPQCRPDLAAAYLDADDANEALLPSQIDRRTRARHVSVVSCGHHALPGQVIARGPRGWVCPECDPGAALVAADDLAGAVTA